MPIRIGPPEMIIILVIVLILFGPGRISRIAGDLGQGIREFRQGLSSVDTVGSNQPAGKTEDESTGEPLEKS